MGTIPYIFHMHSHKNFDALYYPWKFISCTLLVDSIKFNVSFGYPLGIDVAIDIEHNGQRKRCGRGGGRGRCGRGRPQSCPGRPGPYPGSCPFGYGFGGPAPQAKNENKEEPKKQEGVSSTEEALKAQEEVPKPQEEVPMTTDGNKGGSVKVCIEMIY